MMSYEIIYKYHERLESGEYNKEEVKEMKRNVGKPYEEVSLETLASAIMSQLARRDLWVIDCTIYEFKRTQISFKETKGGILIKNKKFLLDQGVIQCINEPTSIDNSGVSSTPSQIVQPKFTQQSEELSEQDHLERPIKWEIFDPDPLMSHELKGYNLTVKKKYPVFKESLNVVRVTIEGMTTEMPTYEYLIIDDTGKKIKISSIHFVPVTKGLSFQGNPHDMPNIRQAKLSYQSPHDSGMPVIRRG